MADPAARVPAPPKSPLSSGQRRAAWCRGLAQCLATGLLLGSATTAGPALAQTRAVAPRPGLAADELNNIAVFKASSPSVVNITALGLQRDVFSMNLQQVPRGTGTGFVWDEAGYIVTNFHVIQGANAARVTLAGQSSHRAGLVGAFPDRDLAVLRITVPKARLPPSCSAAAETCRWARRSMPSATPSAWTRH